MADQFVEDKAAVEEEESGQAVAVDEVGGDGLPEEEEDASFSDSDGGDGEGGEKDDDEEDDDDDDDDFDFNDDFIAKEGEEDGEEEEEEEGGEEEEEKKKKKKIKRHRELVLEEDDYDLLEENTGIRRQRPAQHRRLKKARDIDGEAQHQFAAPEDLQADLFGPDQEDLEDDVGEEGVGKTDTGTGGDKEGGKEMHAAKDAHGGDDDDIFDDDEDDWIVDEFEEAAAAEGGEEAAKAARKARRRKQQAALANIPGVDINALEEAHAIFGDVDEYLERYEMARREREGEVEEEEEEDADEYGDLQPSDLDDEEAAEEMRAQRASKKKSKKKDTAMLLSMDPDAAARHFMLPSDDIIRETDIPEREQIQSSILAPVDVLTSDACAEWIWRQLIFESESKARTIIEDGVREVEGDPPQWLGENWPSESLRNGFSETSSNRGLFMGRFGNDFEAWLENEEAQKALKTSIKALLVRKFKDHEDIPFIAMYRKDELGELLCLRSADEPLDDPTADPQGAIKAQCRRIRRWDILYMVNRLALKYSSMTNRKMKRRGIYNQIAAESGEYDAKSAAALACGEALENSTSMEALDDIESKFKAALTVSNLNEENQPTLGKAKKVERNRLFKLAVQCGLYTAIESFAMSPGEFAENVESGYKVNEPGDPSSEPSEFLEHFVNPENPAFVHVDFVIKCAIKMMAHSLSAEPAVRKAIREQFWNKGAVSTHVLQPGLTALNAFHPLGVAKRIRNKPLRSFKRRDTFLRLSAAEQEGYVRLEIDFADPQEDLQAAIAPLQDLYVSSGLTEQSQAWNDLRREALNMAVEKYILPSIKSEVRRRLAADAMEVVLQETADNLWSYAVKAPVPLLDQDGEEVYDKRIMAAVYGAGDKAGPPSTLVIIDGHGSLIDFLHCPQLSGFIPKRRTVQGQAYSIFDDPKKSRDANRLKDFIEAHLPHAIIIGMGHPEAKSLRADLSLILEKILADNPIAMTSLETGTILQFPADESIAMAWENSNAAEMELPTSPPIIRRAVALAREALDPIAVLASICGQYKEIMTVRLHQLEKYIPNEVKGRYLEEVICSVVAQLGVDLNMAASINWRSSVLPFVPGLGFRKAAALLKTILKNNGAVEERNDLVESGFLGPRVFHNAAPFLRIRPSSDASRNLGINYIDNTRIHPEDYNLAMALAGEVSNADVVDDSLVEYALEHPDKVDKTNLAEFMKKYASQSEESVSLSKLIDIQMELISPYGEIRPNFKELGNEEIFWLVAGEDRYSVKIGRKVEARVRYVSEEAAVCNIPELNGTEAVIEAPSVSSRQNVLNCRDYFKPGDTVIGAIISIDSDNGVIYLSTASNQLNSDLEYENQYLAQQEEYYAIPDKETLQEEEAQRKGAKQTSKITIRPIRHPYFKNITAGEASAEVLAGPIGVAVIRPAAKSFRRLYITMCMPGGLIWNIGIKELGPTAANLRLSTPLEVEPIPGHKFEYEDLDELVVRFIDPVAAAMRALSSHRKWNGGPELGPAKSWEDIQEELRMQKERAPNQAAYCLAADVHRPGAFFLGHFIGSSPRREYFVVLPDGFYFRKKIYGTVEHMLVQFKKNPRGYQQQMPSREPQQMMRPAVPGAYGQQPYGYV